MAASIYRLNKSGEVELIYETDVSFFILHFEELMPDKENQTLILTKNNLLSYFDFTGKTLNWLRSLLVQYQHNELTHYTPQMIQHIESDYQRIVDTVKAIQPIIDLFLTEDPKIWLEIRTQGE